MRPLSRQFLGVPEDDREIGMVCDIVSPHNEEEGFVPTTRIRTGKQTSDFYDHVIFF